jgi:hypothetical protein
MMRLVEALQTLGLQGEVSLGGRWVMLRGERCAVYVVEAAWGTHYYTWCDDPAERAVQSFPDPVQAIQAGLQRASGLPGAEADRQ